jgi:hypothetical protein
VAGDVLRHELGGRDHVVVDEQHEIPLGQRGTTVAGGGRALVRLRGPHHVAPLRRSSEELVGAVRRPVGDDDDLVLVARERLVLEGTEDALQPAQAVVRRYDDADQDFLVHVRCLDTTKG